MKYCSLLVFISSLTADPKAWPVSPTASVSATLAFRGSPGLGKPKLLPDRKKALPGEVSPFLGNLSSQNLNLPKIHD